jgi:hypothetical protein
MSHAGFSGSSHLRASEYNTLKPDQVLSDVHALFRRMQAGICMVENATRTTAGAEFDTLEAWFVLDDPTPRCLKLLCYWANSMPAFVLLCTMAGASSHGTKLMVHAVPLRSLDANNVVTATTCSILQMIPAA